LPGKFVNDCDIFFHPEEDKNGKEKEAFNNQLREAEVWCIRAAVPSVSQKPQLRQGAVAETGPVHRGLRKNDGSDTNRETLKLRATNHQNQT
jgi:hypothetical protein